MQLIIPDSIYQQVMYWVNRADFEVSGLGRVVREGKDTFRVVSAHLLKQEGSSAETDLDAGAIAKLMYDTRNEEGELKWWFHSHVKMNCFWSAQDMKTIKEMGSKGWILASVFNQRNEYRSALCWRTESEFGESTNVIEDLSTEIESLIDKNLIDKWEADYLANVTERAYAAGIYDYTNYSSTMLGDWRTPKTGKDTPPLPMDQDPGILGYGLEEEAKALGMSAKAYRKKLDNRDFVTLNELEDKLVYLELKGKFDHLPIGGTYART